MSKTVKILLLLFVILLLVGGSCIGGAAWWLEANQEQMRASVEKAKAEAAAFAASHDQDQCLDESERRSIVCDGIMCEAVTAVFLEACLAAAQPSPGFCDGVPAADSIVDSATWAIRACQRRRHPDKERCARLLRAWQRQCESDD